MILSNSKILELYNLINSDTYNYVCDIDIDGKIKQVVLKRGQFILTNTSLITGLILTFETHYPRLVVLLDGVDLPITSYHYQGKKVISTAPRGGTDTIKGYASSKVRTWSITFISTNNGTYNKLYDDAYGGLLGITYALTINSVPFVVELAEVVDRYTESGDMALECQFVEYGS